MAALLAPVDAGIGPRGAIPRSRVQPRRSHSSWQWRARPARWTASSGLTPGRPGSTAPSADQQLLYAPPARVALPRTPGPGGRPRQRPRCRPCRSRPSGCTVISLRPSRLCSTAVRMNWPWTRPRWRPAATPVVLGDHRAGAGARPVDAQPVVLAGAGGRRHRPRPSPGRFGARHGAAVGRAAASSPGCCTASPIALRILQARLRPGPRWRTPAPATASAKNRAGVSIDARAPGITPSSITRPSPTSGASRRSITPVMQGPGRSAGPACCGRCRRR